MQHNVFIVGGDNLIQEMFEKKGHKVVKARGAASVVVFTGGEDIDPGLYGEDPIEECGRPNFKRDQEEVDLWEKVGESPCIKIGICRGAQFTNVMNGGRLYQHVNKHTQAHPVFLQKTKHIDNKNVFMVQRVTSTHHQIMIPGRGAELVGYATRATLKKADGKGYAGNLGNDPEIVFYPETNTLCFQPHPEYEDGTAELFFAIFNQLAVKEKVKS